MTKAELLKEFDKLEKEKGVRIEGIYYNSKKSAIEIMKGSYIPKV